MNELDKQHLPALESAGAVRPGFIPMAADLDPDDDYEAFSLRDAIGVLRDEFRWVWGTALLFLVAAILYVMLATRIYSADGLLQVEAPKHDQFHLSTNKEPPPAPDDNIPTDSELQVLKSRKVLVPVVKQFGLDVVATPRTAPVIGAFLSHFAKPGEPGKAWFGLTDYSWGGETLEVSSITVPQNLLSVELTLRAGQNGAYDLLGPDDHLLLSGTVGELAQGGGVTILVKELHARPLSRFHVVKLSELDAVKRLAAGLHASEAVKDSGVVQVSYESPNPQRAAGIVNATLQSYLNQHIAHRQEETTRMLAFINSVLPKQRAEVNQSNKALSDYRAKAGTLQPSQEAQLYLQSSVQVQQQISALQLMRTQWLQSFTANSPEVRSINKQLAQLRKQKATMDAHYAKLPDEARHSIALQRDFSVADNVYVALANKAHELEVNRAGINNNVHVVDWAMPAQNPVAPRGGLVISGAVILGLIGGAALAFMRRKMAGIDDADYIERTMNLPMFGSVLFSPEQSEWDDPHANRRRAGFFLKGPSAPRGAAAPEPVRPLLVAARPRDITVETLRGVRTSMEFGMPYARNRVFAISGPSPGVGKSFVAANLAALYAKSGKRVLLVDGDLRRGHLQQFFATRREGGLSDMLGGMATPAEIVRATTIENLWLVTAGTYPPNPSELLASRRFAEWIASIDTAFDMVLIDTPPVLAVADAAIIASVVGSTIVVLRSGRHSEREIAETLTTLERSGAHVLGGLLNAAPRHRTDYTEDYMRQYVFGGEKMA